MGMPCDKHGCDEDTKNGKQISIGIWPLQICQNFVNQPECTKRPDDTDPIMDGGAQEIINMERKHAPIHHQQWVGCRPASGGTSQDVNKSIDAIWASQYCRDTHQQQPYAGESEQASPVFFPHQVGEDQDQCLWFKQQTCQPRTGQKWTAFLRIPEKFSGSNTQQYVKLAVLTPIFIRCCGSVFWNSPRRSSRKVFFSLPGS